MSNPVFKVTILFNVKKLENNTKESYSYNGGPIESRIMFHRTAQFSMTLNDP